MEQKQTTSEGRGTAMALSAYILWGALPLYWRAIGGVDAGLILANRIVWALVCTAIMLLASRQLGSLRAVFAKPGLLIRQILAGLLISVNWWLYIWAVSQNHVVETSLGYYINPLISVALGLIFLKEKLYPWQIVALALALAGVVILVVFSGTVPWIGLGLALSFGFYALLKKQSPLSSLASLSLETLFAVPLAIALFVFSPPPAAGTGMSLATVLLVLAGPVTVLPLWLFGAASKNISLSRIGFLQYLSPTMGLIIGVVLLNEPFPASLGITFGLIWLGLAVYTADSIARRRRQAALTPSGNGRGRP